MEQVLLDTNVVSELMRAKPSEAVVAWFAQHQQAILFTSAVTQAEVLLGVALLPEGKRKKALAEDAEITFEQDFAGRCLSFDGMAATEYALLSAERTRAGKPMSTADAQIAAIALSHKLALVTRNTKDFSDIRGLQVINPWSYSEVKPN